MHTITKALSISSPLIKACPLRYERRDVVCECLFYSALVWYVSVFNLGDCYWGMTATVEGPRVLER